MARVPVLPLSQAWVAKLACDHAANSREAFAAFVARTNEREVEHARDDEAAHRTAVQMLVNATRAASHALMGQSAVSCCDKGEAAMLAAAFSLQDFDAFRARPIQNDDIRFQPWSDAEVRETLVAAMGESGVIRTHPGLS